MRIAMLASLAESVPPKLYGGTERVVAWLVDELVARSATMSHCSRAETLGPRESSIRCGQGRSGSVERAQTRAPPAPFLWKRLPNAPPILTSSTPTSTGYRSHCSAGSECRFSLRRMVRLDLPGLPDVVREFCKAGFVSISDNQRRHLRGEMDRDDLPRPAVEPVSRFLRPRILPGVLGAPDRGEGAGGCHTHRR